MKNKNIFFRTDRIGDFLLSAVLIKSIKRSDKDSYITVIASNKNFFKSLTDKIINNCWILIIVFA